MDLWADVGDKYEWMNGQHAEFSYILRFVNSMRKEMMKQKEGITQVLYL